MTYAPNWRGEMNGFVRDFVGNTTHLQELPTLSSALFACEGSCHTRMGTKAGQREFIYRGSSECKDLGNRLFQSDASACRIGIEHETQCSELPYFRHSGNFRPQRHGAGGDPPNERQRHDCAGRWQYHRPKERDGGVASDSTWQTMRKSCRSPRRHCPISSREALLALRQLQERMANCGPSKSIFSPSRCVGPAKVTARGILLQRVA